MNNTVKGYINPYTGGALLGLVLFAAYFITGSGLGASAGFARFQVAFLDLFASRVVDTCGYFANLAGGSKNPLDSTAVLMLIGTFTGGLLSGVIHKRLKPELRKGPGITARTRLIMAFSGGTIVGFGARLARGCTSGQGLSGGAVLSVGSWAFMLSVFVGGYLVAWFVRKAWN